MDSYISTQIKNGIATLEFFHEKSNSFPFSQLKKLKKTLEELGEEDDVRLIILKSKGEKVFCAGASFDELLTIDNAEAGEAFFSGFAEAIIAMKDCPKFIIGHVEGKVVGGGVGLVAGCDYALAHENASIRLSELSIGIGPFVIEPAISRKIGVNAFSELTLNPKDWMPASWAKEKGLYNRVFSASSDLEKSCAEFAEQLSAYSPEAMRNLKSILWENAKDWGKIMPQRAKMSGRLVLSDFTKETLKNFKNAKQE